MSRLFENIISGATAGTMLGAAFDGLVIGSAALVAGPIGLLAASSVMLSKTAAGTLIGGAAGVVKTVIEENEGKN